MCGADSEVTEPPCSRVLWISDVGLAREGKVPLSFQATSHRDAGEGPRLEALWKTVRLLWLSEARRPARPEGLSGWGEERDGISTSTVSLKLNGTV